MWSGTPKLAAQPLVNVLAMDSVLVLSSGNASSQQEEWSTTVRRWLKPSLDLGRGPTRSRWMWENRLPGWDGHLMNNGAGLEGHLGPLAELAVPSPVGDVCRHACPHPSG